MTSVIWTSVIGAVGTVLSAIVVAAIPLLLKKLQKLRRQSEDIHVLVNGQLAKIVRRVDLLTKTLQDHGIVVPISPVDERDPPNTSI